MTEQHNDGRILVTHSEIRSGDIGSFGGELRWMATGPFKGDFKDDNGRIWGSFPCVSNERLKKDQRGYIQGCADSTTWIWRLPSI